MAWVTAAREGVGLGKDGFAVIRVTMPRAYGMGAGMLTCSLRVTSDARRTCGGGGGHGDSPCPV